MLSHLLAVAYDPNNPTNIAERLLNLFGGWRSIGLFAVIFAESGLLIGFFLPGDSLLFTAGLLSATVAAVARRPIWIVIARALPGRRRGRPGRLRVRPAGGPALFKRPDSRLFKPENIERAKSFFDQHGSKTIMLARFVPVVRTFAPIVAGVGKMHYRTFVATTSSAACSGPSASRSSATGSVRGSPASATTSTS